MGVRRWPGEIRRLGRNDQVIMTALAVVLGLACGGAAVAFRQLIDIVQLLTYGFRGERVATLAAELPWWQLLVVPAAGGLVIGLATYHLMPRRQPQGVADVIEASALRGGRMSLRTGLTAAALSASSIGFGASVGREGPVVHLGATIGSWVAKRLHLGRRLARTLLGCGVAAAIAASFNAPIAGTFFALEVVIGHYALSAFAPIVIAAVTGTLVSHAVYGTSSAFILPMQREIASMWEFPAFAFLGIVSAVSAMAFMRSINFTTAVFERIPVPPWSRPMAGGLAVGGIAIAFPQVLGVGYEATDAALSELYPLWLLLALIAVKTAATAISLGSGFSGGVFSPSLFLGAMTGGAFGIVATSVFPDLSSGHGAYTMVGMGAVAGSVLGAPISTILMIFELTADYALTIAVMVATVIASVITTQVHGRSFFHWQLERRNIKIAGGQEVGLLSSIKVRSVMNRDCQRVVRELPIGEVRRRLQRSPHGLLFVVDETGRLVGRIEFQDLHEAAFDTSHDAEWTAISVARKETIVLQAADDLTMAVQAHRASGEVFVAVVEDRDSMKLAGVVHEHDVMSAYHRTLDEARAEERGLS